MHKNKGLRIFLVLFAVILTLAVIILVPMKCRSIKNSFSVMSHTDRAPVMVAHRGLSSLYPQNTMPAFEAAVEYGFDGVECDIHTTKDGKWVILHDDTVDKTTDGTGAVNDLTFEEIQALTVDYGNGIENYKNLKIPTFEEYLELCSKSDITPVIEIKSCEEKYLPELKKLIDSYQFTKAPIIIDFNRDHLEIYRELDSEVTMMLLATSPTKDDAQWCIDNNATLSFHYAYLAKSFSAISYAKKNNVPLASWTVDNPVFEDVLVLYGVESITTNKLLP